MIFRQTNVAETCNFAFMAYESCFSNYMSPQGNLFVSVFLHNSSRVLGNKNLSGFSEPIKRAQHCGGAGMDYTTDGTLQSARPGPDLQVQPGGWGEVRFIHGLLVSVFV